MHCFFLLPKWCKENCGNTSWISCWKATACWSNTFLYQILQSFHLWTPVNTVSLRKLGSVPDPNGGPMKLRGRSFAVFIKHGWESPWRFIAGKIIELLVDVPAMWLITWGCFLSLCIYIYTYMYIYTYVYILYTYAYYMHIMYIYISYTYIYICV